jgi:hypothetical protein
LLDRSHPPRSAYKSLFGSFSSEKEQERVFFFLKKKEAKKTFIQWWLAPG